ncbi:MAG: nucleotidyltransferase family protein [Dehalococcoidia bacterium]
MNPSVSALLLSAGESRRLKGIKPLLPFPGGTLLSYQLDSLSSVPEIGEVLVVVGHRHRRLLPVTEGRQGVRAAVNRDYRLGPASSIRAGLREMSPGAENILILGVDQPRPRWVLEGLVAGHLRGGALITAPTYRGKRGHPTLFSASLLPELLAISEEKQGLREVMSRHRAEVHQVELDTPAVLLDINTQEDYEQALGLLGP